MELRAVATTLRWGSAEASVVGTVEAVGTVVEVVLEFVDGWVDAVVVVDGSGCPCAGDTWASDAPRTVVFGVGAAHPAATRAEAATMASAKRRCTDQP